MTANATVVRGTVFEDGGAAFLARVYDPDGEPISIGSLASVTFKVFDLTTGSLTPTATGTVSIEDCVFNTLQADDPRWTADDIGFNFAHAMPAAAFPTGSHSYRVEYKLTPDDGEVFWLVFEVEAIAIMSS